MTNGFSISSIQSETQFNLIQKHIHEMQLDDRVLKKEEFLIAKKNEDILGFGRLRNHGDCEEMCSLGVIEPERNKGIGKALTLALIQKAEQPLYLVCIIPDFFIPLGFKVVDLYPDALKEKLNYCTNDLPVPEKYVVMKYPG